MLPVNLNMLPAHLNTLKHGHEERFERLRELVRRGTITITFVRSDSHAKQEADDNTKPSKYRKEEQ